MSSTSTAGIKLESLTDTDLAHEHAICMDVITRAIFWGDDVADAQSRRRDIEQEQFRRKLAAVRSAKLHITPFVTDAPAPRMRSPIITGAAKARSERRLSGAGLAIALGTLLVCLAVSVAFAGQRLHELDRSIAAMERV